MKPETKKWIFGAFLVFLFGITSSISARQIIYVDVDATGSNNGKNWQDAYKCLQNALDIAESDDEIRVAQGTYRPDQRTVDTPRYGFHIISTGEREATFKLRSGVVIKGGYAGFGEPIPDARDITSYETILSGDLKANDIELKDFEWHTLYTFTGHQSLRDNSHTVVTGSDTDKTAILDGFTITAGHAEPPSGYTGQDLYPDPYQTGGGMLCESGSPTVVKCTFWRNSARSIESNDTGGAGMANFDSSPTLRDCNFIENIVFSSNVGGYGAGIFDANSYPKLINCLFSGNVATGLDGECWGGGMYNLSSNPTLIDCSFIGNSALPRGDLTGLLFFISRGGAIFNHGRSNPKLTNCILQENFANAGGGIFNMTESSPTLTNCTFRKNKAVNDGLGGGMFNSTNCNPTVTNCIFGGNSAESDGGGMYNGWRSNPLLTNCIFSGNLATGNGGGMYNNSSSPTVTNCTFSGNGAYENGGGMFNENSTPTLSSCMFTGNWTELYGGGLHSNESTTIAINCVFRWNSAYSSRIGGGNGGGIYISRGSLTLDNCTFSGNVAARAHDGICCAGNRPSYYVIMNISNCILWDGGDEIRVPEGSTTNITYSNIQGDWPGEGNIDADPLFVDPDGPDNIPGTEDDNLRLSLISPCVDGGDPGYVPGPDEIDLDGNPRIVSGRIDMGAYEFQGIIYVDDLEVSDPLENGTEAHPFDTIQEAIDIAKEGYKVLVLPGVYSKINFKGKAITVAGTKGAAVIEAGWLFIGRAKVLGQDAVTFHTGEGPNSVLKNFIIRNSGMAISLNYGSSPTIRNVTIVDNDFGIAAYENSNPDISNCIFWNNEDGDLFQCQARYSCIESGGQGEGNISVDPLFVDAANGDYHLKSEGWRWNANSESWTWDDVTSRCIDAGDPACPLGDELMSVPRDPNNIYGVNRRINMGAFGGTYQASIPPHGWVLLADLNNDGCVNYMDLDRQVKDWLTRASELAGDLNHDGIVNMVDFTALAENWPQKSKSVE